MKTPLNHTLQTSMFVILGISAGFVHADQDGQNHRGESRPGDRTRLGLEQPDRHKTGQGPREGARLRGKFKSFKEADADQDGWLSFEEFSQMSRLKSLEEPKRRKLFDYLDRDKDGQLHMRELQPREPVWIGPLRKGFQKLDADRSGALDITEFSKLPEFRGKDRGMVHKYFERMDRNKNHQIDRSELKSMTAQRSRPDFDFSKFDANSNGALDFQEYSSIPWMEKFPEERRKKLFDRIDANKNGEVSQKEIRSAHQVSHPMSPHDKPPRPHRGGRPREDHGKQPGKPPRRKGPGWSS